MALKITLFLLAFVVSLVVIESQQDCPEGLCDRENCPAYWSADCTLSSDCIPTFTWKGRDVSERCGSTLCDERVCGRNRECVEELFPPMCREGVEQCRQYMRSKCILKPFEHLMSCDDIECAEGLTCRFRERPHGFRPIVRCVPE